MKRLIIKELQLCSFKESKAKRVKLDPRRNLIVGANDTGKSCLMKSFYHAFGANVKFEDHWVNAEVKLLVTFEVDGKIYSILRDDRTFSFYDSDLNHIRSFTSIGKGIGPYLTELFNFKLKLESKGDEQLTPTPSFVFLPFYIDQDKGWSQSFNSFENLQMFKNFRSPTIEYHTAIHPNEYYETKLDIKEIQGGIAKSRVEIEAVESLISKQRERFKEVDFNFDVGAYKKEIEELLEQANTIKIRESECRSILRELYDEKHVVEHQLSSVKRALHEADKDFKFATAKFEDSLICPICQTHFENDFESRIDIAKDLNKFDQLLSELETRLLQINEKIASVRVKLDKVVQEYQKTNFYLSEKKKHLELKDLIKAEGKRELLEDLKLDRDVALSRLTDQDNKLKILNEKLKSFNDKDRKEKIQDTYIYAIKKYLSDLDVNNIPEQKYRKITSIIEKSGSDKPRAILAYFYAIIDTIRAHSTSIMCPLIIDSPNQQAQDPENIQNILEVIRDKSPNDAQVILAVENAHEVDFDWQRIPLEVKLNLLEEKNYETVAGLFRQLIAKRKAG